MKIKSEAARRGGLFTLTCAPRMSEALWVVNGPIFEGLSNSFGVFELLVEVIVGHGIFSTRSS